MLPWVCSSFCCSENTLGSKPGSVQIDIGSALDENFGPMDAEGGGDMLSGVMGQYAKKFAIANRVLNSEAETRKLQDRLTKAARTGDFKRCVEAVSQGALIDSKNLRGQTPLMLCACSYNPGIPKAGGSSSSTSPANKTKKEKDKGNHAEKERGPNADQPEMVGGTIDSLKFMLGAKADIEAKDEAGWTSLLHACRSGRQLSVEFLLQRSAAIKVRATDGKTVVMLATMDGADHLVLYLLKNKAPIEKKDEEGWSALFYACREKNKDLVKKMLDLHANPSDRAKDGGTALIVAAQGGNTRIGKMLHKKGAKLNPKTAYGNTALMTALDQGNEEFSQWLLDENCEVGTQNQDELTALDYADMSGMQSMKGVLEMKLRSQAEEGGFII